MASNKFLGAYDFYEAGLDQVYKNEYSLPCSWEEVHEENFCSMLVETKASIPSLQGYQLEQEKSRLSSYTLLAHMIGPKCLKLAAECYQTICDMQKQ